MARDLFAFAPTLSTGTTSAAPQRIPLTMPARKVTRVEVMVPPGPNGVCGFALGAANQQVYPYNAGGWIIADDEVIGWDIHDGIESGAWQFIGYNTGFYPHTFNVRFYADTVAGSNASVLPFMSATDLSNVVPLFG